MDIWNLSFTVNANFTPFSQYIPNDTTEQKMDNFIHEFQKGTEHIININGNDGWHAGQAFYNTLTYHRKLDDSDKKYCFACAVISLIKALEMGTMQSVMAVDLIINMLKSNKDITDVYLLAMPDNRMVEDFKMPINLTSLFGGNIKDVVNSRLTSIIEFLTALKENRINSIDDKTKVGQYYISALFQEAYERLMGYTSFGFIP